MYFNLRLNRLEIPAVRALPDGWPCRAAEISIHTLAASNERVSRISRRMPGTERQIQISQGEIMMPDAGSRSCDDVTDANCAGCLAEPVDRGKRVNCKAHYRVNKTSMLLALTRSIGGGAALLSARGERVRHRGLCLHLGHA